MSFGQKLRQLRAENRLTQQELSELMDVSVVAVQSWEGDRKRPGMEALIGLSRVLQVSIDELLETGMQTENAGLSSPEWTLITGYRSLDEYGKRAVESICGIELERMNAKNIRKTAGKVVPFTAHTRKIPYFALPSAAGYSTPLDDMPYEMIEVDDSVPGSADFAIYIQGNSMMPYIHDGQMVFVHRQEELAIGDVGIFSVDGAMYCKQYDKKPDGTLMLVSANEALKESNIVISPDSGQTVAVCGKVLLGRKIPLPEYLSEN